MHADWKHFEEALKRRDNDVNSMYGWFRKLFVKSVPSSHSSLSPKKTPTPSTKPPPSALSSPVRWDKNYDVCVCYSSVHIDIEEAIRLVSFLEASPRSLRCFLWHRDSNPGGAIPTECCQAVQNSHCVVLLITPDFVQDDWCKYMMNQVLAEGPMTKRMIPLRHNLPLSQYPLELKFRYYINLGEDLDKGYNQVNNTVLNYLEDMVKHQKTHCNTDSSSNRCDEVDSPREN